MFTELEKRIESLGIIDDSGIILEALINDETLSDQDLLDMADGL